MTTVPAPATLTILSEFPSPPTAIGLIAGGGRLPILVAEGLRKAGHPIHGLGLSNLYEPTLPAMCESFRDVGLLRVGTWGRILSGQGVRHAIMVGKVDKAKLMHDPLRLVRNIPDMRTIVGWYRHLRHDRRSHAVLTAIAEELDRCGVTLLDSTGPIPDQMATPGVMGSVQPSKEQLADIAFAWPLLLQALKLDIGQAIAVRERDVIAVEAVEGTDRTIARTGELCRAKGWTLCKGARAGHDRRSDVPTIGVKTIELLSQHGAGCLALSAGDVIMLDKARLLGLADDVGIAVVGIPTAATGPAGPGSGGFGPASAVGAEAPRMSHIPGP